MSTSIITGGLSCALVFLIAYLLSIRLHSRVVFFSAVSVPAVVLYIVYAVLTFLAVLYSNTNYLIMLIVGELALICIACKMGERGAEKINQRVDRYCHAKKYFQSESNKNNKPEINLDEIFS